MSIRRRRDRRTGGNIRHRLAALLPTLVLALVTACAADLAPPTAGPAAGTSFAGPVAGTGALFAAVVNAEDRQVLAYLCDGATTAIWLRGQVDAGGTLTATAREGATLAGRIEGAQLTGTLTLPGRPDALAVTAPVVTAPAGLYRARGQVDGRPALGGWIQLPDGTLTGRVRSGAGFIDQEGDLARPDKPTTSFMDPTSDF